MLSSNARKALENACPQNRGSAAGAPGSDGAEIANAIDNGGSASKAAAIAALTPVGSQTPAVDQATTNANIAALQAKIDAIIAALQS